MRSSSTVMVPLPSASMERKSCCRPLISSSLSDCAITTSAAFFNLFIADSFFMRLSTTLSSGLSSDAPCAFSHACCAHKSHHQVCHQ